MSETVQTVKGALPPPDLSDIAEAVTKLVREGDTGVALAKAEFGEDALAKAARSAVDDALDISILDLVVDGCKALGRFRKLLGTEGPMDDKPNVVTVLDDRVTLKAKPEIVLVMGDALELRRIGLEVSVTLTLGLLVVTVVNRRIRGLSAGKANAKAAVKVEGVKVVERDLGTLALPERHLVAGDEKAEAAPS